MSNSEKSIGKLIEEIRALDPDFTHTFWVDGLSKKVKLYVTPKTFYFNPIPGHATQVKLLKQVLDKISDPLKEEIPFMTTYAPRHLVKKLCKNLEDQIKYRKGFHKPSEEIYTTEIKHKEGSYTVCISHAQCKIEPEVSISDRYEILKEAWTQSRFE